MLVLLVPGSQLSRHASVASQPTTHGQTNEPFKLCALFVWELGLCHYQAIDIMSYYKIHRLKRSFKI